MNDRQAWQSGKLTLHGDLIWSLAISSLRVRLGRALLTVGTIATATAFVMYLLSMPGNADPTQRQTWSLMLAMAIVVSAAGVLNTMLMSVTQRYREIGTIKCLGGLDQLVLLSVLLEAAMLGLVGSVAGVLIGSVIALVLGSLEHGGAMMGIFLRLHAGENEMLPWLAPLPLRVLAVLGIGVVLTAVSAAPPAFIAAKMPPVEAMRGEK